MYWSLEDERRRARKRLEELFKAEESRENEA
jgi:hypothetical protein